MTTNEGEHLESLLGSPAVLVSLQEPAHMPKADWNKALALDAICRRAESALRECAVSIDKLRGIMSRCCRCRNSLLLE